MRTNSVGILGGMGPAAGVYFAKKLIELNTTAKLDAEHVTFILYSDSQVPSRVDSFLNKSVSPVPMLTEALRKLESLGATYGVIVCNTAHIYFDELLPKVNLPLINMIENVAEHASRLALEGRKVGVLATAATIKSGLYTRHFKGSDIDVVVPTDEEQNLVSAAIFGPDFGIKATGMTASNPAKRMLAAAADSMRRRTGIRHLVLGCTELSFAIPDAAWRALQIIDPVTALAQTCLLRAGVHQATAPAEQTVNTRLYA